MITKDMTIGEIVEKHPNAADLMANFGLHCMGCHTNPFETLESGVLSHGFSSDDLNMLLTELNTLEENKGRETITLTQPAPLTVSEAAAKEIKNLLEVQRKADHGLKVCVIPGGCAGFRYEISFVKEPTSNDLVVEDKGLKLFVDPTSAEFLAGAQIEYTAGLMGAGFKVTNPNEKKACGCGNSIGF